MELRQRIRQRRRAMHRRRFLRRLPKQAVCAEIGVLRGVFTRAILNVASPRELHLIDAWWDLYGERYPDWGEHTDFGTLGTREAYDEVVEVVERHRGNASCQIHVGDDVEILERFPDDYFDWVYLDTSHAHDHTRRELTVLERKVGPHGLIAGDDWHPGRTHPGVAAVVKEFVAGGRWELVEVDSLGQWLLRPTRR
jgi:hypothetical protein